MAGKKNSCLHFKYFSWIISINDMQMTTLNQKLVYKNKVNATVLQEQRREQEQQNNIQQLTINWSARSSGFSRSLLHILL